MAFARLRTQAIAAASAAALLTALAPGSALAQNEPDWSEFTWEGFYAGLHLDFAIYEAEASDLTDVITNDLPSLSSELLFTGGVNFGYNWELEDGFIIGAELDTMFAQEASRSVPTNASATNEINFESTLDSLIAIRMRAGMTQGRVHTYIAAGIASAESSFLVEDTSTGNSATVGDSLLGITYGAGIEYAFRPDVIGRFEFVGYDLPSTEAPILEAGGGTACTGGGASEECTVFFNNSSSSFRIGVNYKF
ncbi:MAG: outer membrane protein [Rubricella sp.]